MEVFYFNERPIKFEQVKETWENAYSGTLNKSYWDWRFLNNPNEEYPNISYVEIDGKIASFYSVSRINFNMGGHPVKSALMNMGMTHPEFKGKGIYPELVETFHKKLIEDGYKFFYGFANHNSHRIHRRDAGWKDILVLNNFICQSSTISSKIKNEDRYQFVDNVAVSQDISLFEDMYFAENDVYFGRDLNFIEWRFVYNPVYKYFFLKIMDKDFIMGIVVYKFYNGNIDVMEVFSSPGISNTEILKNGLLYLSKKADNIFIWSNIHSDEHVLLESFGFIEEKFNTYFGYTPCDEDFKIDISKIHFRFTDSDVY